MADIGGSGLWSLAVQFGMHIGFSWGFMCSNSPSVFRSCFDSSLSDEKRTCFLSLDLDDSVVSEENGLSVDDCQTYLSVLHCSYC